MHVHPVELQLLGEVEEAALALGSAQGAAMNTAKKSKNIIILLKLSSCHKLKPDFVVCRLDFLIELWRLPRGEVGGGVVREVAQLDCKIFESVWKRNLDSTVKQNIKYRQWKKN